MSLHLYDIRSDYLSVLADANAEAEANDGVIPDDLASRLDAVSESLEEKAINCGLMYKTLCAEAAGIKLEEDRLSKRRKRAENQAEWLKAYMASCLQSSGFVVALPSIEINWISSKRLIVDDVSKIPADYLRIVPETREPDKMAIKAAMKRGIAFDEAAHIETVQNIQIN